MRKEKNRSPLLAGNGAVTLMASLLCILIGLAVGYLILLLFDAQNAYEKGFKRLLMGGFYMKKIGVGREIASAAPLIMTGLSVAFAFKTGLFNIGAAGQYTVGAFGCLLCAIVLKMPWWACLLAAMVFGALWGAIPGIFKAYLNINEVITAIMFNWIGLYAVNTIIFSGGNGPMYDAKLTTTYNLREKYPQALIPSMGLNQFFKNNSTTIAIFLAMVVAVIIYVVINKTTFGYELKACGSNKNAAKYAGINDKKNIILAMVISGALAGMGAGLYYLSGMGCWNPQESTALPGIGFEGISVALLASSNPIAVIFSGLFISHISTGGGFLDTNSFAPEIADMISGIIIYLCAFSLLFRLRLQKLFSGGRKRARADAGSDPEQAQTPGKEGKQ